MNSREKSGYTWLAKMEEIKTILPKLTIGNTLEEEEKNYILACALILAKYYEKDKRFTSYLEFAYYIILKYSIVHEDFEPLYDFTINFGFYPIAKKIYNLGLIDTMSLSSAMLSIRLNNFSHNGYIETLEQKRSREAILNEESGESCFIAPTSFGKSSVILDYINKYKSERKRICIIVPTRSLLMQTYRMIKESGFDRKVIIHDEMYNDEERFISIFTQERALRMLENHDTNFDLLFIDEAHNIFNKDSRSILLARAINFSKRKNSNVKVIYLSPLISNHENLKLSSNHIIKEQRITFNIKEPELFEWKLDGHVLQYNRFLNEYYMIGFNRIKLDYIIEKSQSKNFVYLRAPRKIETFANELANKLNRIDENSYITSIVELLKKNVHEDFYAISLLEKGVIYLHGKLPELIKEYLENKFKTISEIRYVVANSVILEGMNLPIDTLFVLNTYSLQNKELTNLIGRVNRLNSIFSNEENRLEKLLPKIHFINSEEYNRPNSNMENKIKLLRSKSFTDEIKNPVLQNFNIDEVIEEAQKNKILETIKLEKLILKETHDDLEKIKVYLIKEGFTLVYENIDEAAVNIMERIELLKSENYQSSMLDKINIYFIKDIGKIIDFEIRRLKENETRNFYENHIRITHMNTLKENILSMFRYFKKRIAQDKARFYIGESYGELEYQSEVYKEPTRKVYVNLKDKDDKQLINLAIIKLELENQFIRFKLNKFIIMLHDFNLISDIEYNSYIYGTTDENKIKFARYGLSMNLINRLEAENQLQNIKLDNYNNLVSNDAFEEFTEQVDDFFKYEIMRNF